MLKEERFDYVFFLYSRGERGVTNITRMVNAKFKSVTQRQTIEKDIADVKRYNERWAADLADGGEMIRLQRYEKYIEEAIDIIQDQIRDSAKDKGKGAYKLGNIAHHLTHLMKFQLTLATNKALVQENTEIRKRLLDKEALLNEKLAAVHIK